MVLPEPEGAEKMMSFSNVFEGDFPAVKVGILKRIHQMWMYVIDAVWRFLPLLNFFWKNFKSL